MCAPMWAAEWLVMTVMAVFPGGAVALGVSGSLGLALLAAGLLYLWGLNSHGQIGNGSCTDYICPPTLLDVPGQRFAAVGTGTYFSGAVTLGVPCSASSCFISC